MQTEHGQRSTAHNTAHRHSVGSVQSAARRTCSSIWTSVRRVDSVPMDIIWSTTPITTKLISPAGANGGGRAGGQEHGPAGARAGG